MKHGLTGYANHGCRCEVCRTARGSYQRMRRQQTRAIRDAARASGAEYVAKGISHGLGGYQYHSCRCLACKVANAAASAKRRGVVTGGAR